MQDATTFDGKFGINHTQLGSAPGVFCVLSLPVSPRSLLEREGSGSRGVKLLQKHITHWH